MVKVVKITILGERTLSVSFVTFELRGAAKEVSKHEQTPA
jgi:hypothetical protein